MKRGLSASLEDRHNLENNVPAIKVNGLNTRCLRGHAVPSTELESPDIVSALGLAESLDHHQSMPASWALLLGIM